MMPEETSVEIFRTNITRIRDATQIELKVVNLFPDYEINFDLEDCDHILRIKSRNVINTQKIAALVNELGFRCELFLE